MIDYYKWLIIDYKPNKIYAYNQVPDGNYLIPR